MIPATRPVGFPRLRLFAAFALLCTPALHAQFVRNSQDDARYAISGTVVNSLTGEPIPRALVQLQGPTQAATLTDQSGHFELAGLRRGPAVLVPRKPGFFTPQELGEQPIYRPTTYDVGPDAQPVTLKLVPAASLSGRIIGDAGEPVENAAVFVYTSQIANGRKRWQQVNGVNGDEDGYFRVGNLRPGHYLVAVGAAARIPLTSFTQARPQGYPAQWFYPGVPTRRAATPIELAAGQNFQADFSLRLQPVFKVAGTVMQPPGTRGLYLELQSADGETVHVPRRQMGRNFELLQVPAGAYTLVAMTNDERGNQYSARIPLNVTADLGGLVVAPDALPSVAVVFRSEPTKTQEPGPGGGAPRPPSVQLQFQQLDPPYNTMWATQQGTPDDPQWQARLTPGRYDVQMPAYGPWYVQSATCGTTDLLRDPLVVAAGAQVPPIAVTLRDDGGTLTIKLNGDVPDPGAQILVYADREPTQQPRMSFLSRPMSPAGPYARPMMGYVSVGGAAQLHGLAPGEYTILPVDRLDGLEYQNADVMRKYLPRAAHAVVTANSNAEITVDLIRTSE